LEILETNFTERGVPNTFAPRSPKVIHLTPGEHGEDLEVDWEKVACWSTKPAVSLKRVKIEEKLPWKAYRNSATLFRTIPPLTLNGFLFPKAWC